MQNSDLLELHTFGQVMINWRTDPKPLTLPPRETILLIYLAYQRVAVSRAHLCHLFWPDDPSARARGNLRKLLLDTRRSVGSLLVATADSVALQQDLRYWLDAHEFQWQMQPLEQAPKPFDKTSMMATPRLQRGIQLYQGDFLGTLKHPKSHIFSRWLEQEQQRFHQQAVHALKILVEQNKHEQHYEEALRYSQHLIELDPLDEEAQEQSLRLLAQMGRIEEVKLHYQRYSHQLKTELACEPEPALTQLYQQLCANGTPTSSQAVSKTAGEAATERQSFRQPIPKLPTPLFGRAESLHQLQQYLTDPTIRLITIVGMGGIGKTHLALTLLEQQAHNLAIDPVFIPVQEMPIKEEAGESQRVGEKRALAVERALTQALTTALALPVTTTDTLSRQLGAYLHDRRLLFVLDGFEAQMAGAAFVMELLQQAPLSKVLVTSRECLQLPGEVLLQLEGLALPTTTEEALILAEWQSKQTSIQEQRLDASAIIAHKAPALQLFLHCQQRQNARLFLSAENLQSINQICQLVEGNPLAIELVAALALHYSWCELVEQLQNDLTILQTSYHSHKAQRSMSALLEDSWQLLSVQEQAALRALAIFPGVFTRREATTRAINTPELLIALVNKSLLRTKGAGLYEMPRLVRLFVQSKG